MVGGAVAEPGIELGGVLELLSTPAGHHEVAAVGIGESGDVAPDLFELGDGEDVFLSVTPAFLDVFEGEVGGHARSEVVHARPDFGLVVGEDVFPGQGEEGEEIVEIDPGGEGVVVGEAELGIFLRHGQAFDQPGSAVNAGQAATAIFEAAGDHLEVEASAGLQV